MRKNVKIFGISQEVLMRFLSC